MGIWVDKADFVLIDQYVDVMGGRHSQNYELYQSIAVRAYNTLRKHWDEIVNLFSMMMTIKVGRPLV
jgi:phosphatidylinositol 4-kinase A